MVIARSGPLAFILLVVLFVDLTVSLPTIYTEAEDSSYRSKPCTSNPTPENVQQAVNSASPGDIICLQPGVEYPQILVNSAQGSNSDYITIRNANLSLLPPAGVRISPLYVRKLPILDGGVVIMEGSRYRFVGLYFAALRNVSYSSLIYTSSTADHIIVDQCYSKYLQAGSAGYYTVTLLGSYLALMNSYIEDRSFGTMITTCSVLKVTNNYFDNSDTFLLTEKINTDFEIRFNYLQKKEDTDNFVGLSFTSGSSRIWIDSNYIAPSNPDAGIFSSAIFTTAMDELTVTNNYFDTCQLGVSVGSTSYAPSSTVVHGNFFANITSSPIYLADGISSYNIYENTMIGNPSIMSSVLRAFIDNTTDLGLIFERNIATGGQYGIGTSGGKIYEFISADKFTWNDNVIIGDPYIYGAFPSVGTIFEEALDNISFVDPSRRDYQLLSTSPYTKENYGKQLGVDLCALVRSAKLKFVLTNCSLTDIVIQPTEILVINDVLLIIGNLTMYPDSVLKVDGVNAINITSCAQFDGTLDLTNVNQMINQTFVVAYYSCWTGGQFKDITYNDQTSDDCNKLKVELNYQPTLVTATIVLVDQCQTGQTPSRQSTGNGPSTVGGSGPSGSQDNKNGAGNASLPDWFLPVVIVGGAVFLTLVFIVLAVSVPWLKQRVFHKKLKFHSSMEVSQRE